MTSTEASSRWSERAPRRALGLALLAAAYLPAHRLLDPARTGAAGASTQEVGEALWGVTLWGTVLVAGLAFVLARLFPVPLRETLRRVGDRIERLGTRRVAAAAGAIALGLSSAAAIAVFDRLPTLADAMVQLLQARAWAAGRWAAPLAPPAAARLVQNGWSTSAGWVSIYPPGHTALLALGFRLGAPWLVDPLCAAITATATVLAARRLLPDRPRTALLGGLLAALSPFLVLIGGGYLSHPSAAAAGAVALWCALRARDGRPGWAIAAGLATGAMVLIRPWTGLALGATLTAGLWCASAWEARQRARGWLIQRLSLWALGGVAPAVVLGAYDARFFGHPLRLGYEAAFGPAHGLGLHRDPWGDLYGAREALAYSGFDLMTLGGQLLETPLSVVGVVGLWLMLARALPRGAGVLLAWALVPVAANALYWHHGYHLGPRMLYEAGPAWCVLAVLAVVELARGEGRVARVIPWAAALAVAAGLLLQVPGRVTASLWSDDAIARATPPTVAEPANALVFVHGSWGSRVAARLAASGMRRDSIETALRRNDLCLVDGLATALASGSPAGASVDFDPLPGSPDRLRAVEVAAGTFVRIDPTLAPSPACTREARADRLGTIELEPLAWQTPIPELERGGPLLFRDLGPEANATVLARHAGTTAWVQLPAPGGLVPYAEAMRTLWETEPAAGEAAQGR